MNTTQDWLKLWEDKKLRCPQCGRGVFAPNVANVHKPEKIEQVVFWCTDMGHWAGYITDCKVVKDGDTDKH